VLRGHTNHVTALAFLPDGRRLVSANADATSLIWEIAAPQGHPGRLP
jgi:WD40 repeat protein